jgi:hypothetical protein
VFAVEEAIVQAYKDDKAKGIDWKVKMNNILNGQPLTEDGYTLNIGYKQSRYGRLEHRIQNVPKALRGKLFKGWHHYDINASAPTLLSQHYQQLFRKETPELTDYVQNKQQTRERLASELNISLSEAKEIFNSLFFGINIPTERQALHYNKLKFREGFELRLVELLGQDVVLKLNKLEWFYTLKNEVRQVINDLIQEYKQIFSSGKLSNEIGIELSLDNWRSRGLIIHYIYVGIERLIINTIINFFGTTNMVYIHDGFISERYIDPNQLEQLVFDNTQLKVSFDYTTLT